MAESDIFPQMPLLGPTVPRPLVPAPLFDEGNLPPAPGWNAPRTDEGGNLPPLNPFAPGLPFGVDPAAIAPGSSVTAWLAPPIDYATWIQQQPDFLQGNQWLDQDTARAQFDLARDRARAIQVYNMNVSQANAQGRQGGDYGEAEAAAMDALAREKAAHDYANQQETMREVLASRGMADSGQKAWEAEEGAYQQQQYLKQLDLQAQARSKSIAAARSSAQSNLSSRLQEMAMMHGFQLEDIDLASSRLIEDTARNRGNLVTGLLGQYAGSGRLPTRPSAMAEWMPDYGAYQDIRTGAWYNSMGQPISAPGKRPAGPGPVQPIYAPDALPAPPPPAALAPPNTLAPVTPTYPYTPGWVPRPGMPGSQ